MAYFPIKLSYFFTGYCGSKLWLIFPLNSYQIPSQDIVEPNFGLFPIKLLPNSFTGYCGSKFLLIFHKTMDVSRRFFHAGLLVKILKPHLSSLIQATFPAYFSVLHSTTATEIGELYELCSISLWNFIHSPFSFFLHQILAFGSCFQIPSDRIPPLIYPQRCTRLGMQLLYIF